MINLHVVLVFKNLDVTLRRRWGKRQVLVVGNHGIQSHIVLDIIVLGNSIIAMNISIHINNLWHVHNWWDIVVDYIVCSIVWKPSTHTSANVNLLVGSGVI